MIFLIGNKLDLEDKREVSFEEANKFKNDNNIDLYMETSAKTGYNIKEVFVEATKLLYNKYKENKVNNMKRMEKTKKKKRKKAKTTKKSLKKKLKKKKMKQMKKKCAQKKIIKIFRLYLIAKNVRFICVINANLFIQIFSKAIKNM